MPRYLVIVESPAKARILSRFLGDDFLVEASIGHVRDLPESAAQIPEQVKKEPWARLGVNVDEGFEPLYVVSAEKKKQVKKLKDMLKEVEHLYLATDEDREGESISWHLLELLRPKVPHERLVYHEITKEAIDEALEQAREIDMNLVRAQEARRIVDRLYGYAVSPLLWKKIKPQLSAGRVQSVAVRLVVEREEERIRFKPAVYWDLEAKFRDEAGAEEPFEATLQRLGEKKLAGSKDFDPETGKLKKEGADAPLWLEEAEAKALEQRLRDATPKVLGIEEKPYTERPGPPFTTSTLQQAANGRFRYAARRTMDLAQRLYENGFITYMRTDSVTLSQEALHASRDEIRGRFGDAFVPEKPRFYKGKVKNAQEAHEAIRPAGRKFTSPEEVGKQLGQDAKKLYELIFQRTLASQMPDARGQRVRVEIGLDDAVFACGGKTVEFPGFQRVYPHREEKENKIPQLEEGQTLVTHELDPKEHRTQPPARLSEASLVKELEARGIGRPSTYASIIETILRRGYVRKQGTALIPSFTAFAVTKLMREYLTELVDYSFTAEMEDELDQISLGELDQKTYLSRFYHGNGNPGLQQRLENVEGEIDPREVCGLPLGNAPDGELVEVRIGRYGPFVSKGELRQSIPEETVPDEFGLADALDFLEKAARGPREVGKHPETGEPVYAKTGRYGPYVQHGDQVEGGDKPKMSSLLEGMDPETVTLDEAVKLLALPITLGTNPEGEEVQAANGRYGPYVKAGTETRSLPKELSPIAVTLEQALHLLAQPKPRGRKRAAPKAALRTLREKTEEQPALRVMDGRWGPYVTDGTVNASLPKGTTVEELTVDFALELLEERAKKAPRKKKAAKKKSSAKKAPKKSAKKSPKKKAAKKKARKKS